MYNNVNYLLCVYKKINLNVKQHIKINKLFNKNTNTY